MDWIFTAAFVMVAMGIIMRLLWWVHQQSRSLAAQKQASRDTAAKPDDAVHVAESGPDSRH